MNKNNVIIGLTGTHGAGKGTVVDYLVGKGLKHFSAREFLYRELDKRGLSHDRDALRSVANDLRAKFGPEYVAFSLYKAAHESGHSAVIESIYTVGEIENIRDWANVNNENFVLVAVDADTKIRYERISKHRKSETDMISYEKFLEQQDREMESTDSTKQNLVACRKLADKIVMNNGTMEEFNEILEGAFSKYLK